MIYRHNYLSEAFLTNKTIHKVSEEKPLVVVLSQKFTFLNNLLLHSLKLSKVKFQVKQTDESSVMSYQLPAIAFLNYFLSQQTLIEFIADLMLQKQSLSDMTQRKQIGKQQYRNWYDVIKEESQGLCRYSNLKHLGILTQQDYHNHLFSQFFSLASWVKGDILQRKYDGFNRNQMNFQNLLVYDIIDSILLMCPQTKVDHILRAHFENLIQFHAEFKIKIQNSFEAQEEQNQIKHEIVTDKIQEKNAEQYPNFKFNGKKFAIAFVIAAGIYVKWVQ